MYQINMHFQFKKNNRKANNIEDEMMVSFMKFSLVVHPRTVECKEINVSINEERHRTNAAYVQTSA